MTDLTFLNPLSKLKWHSRQAAPARHISDSLPKTISHSAIKSARSPEPKGSHVPGNGQKSTDKSRSPLTQTINVMLIGETGVGKSSVINLIARKEIAHVSSDVNRCTMQCTRYDIPFDNMHFAIFDTISLEGPQLGANEYLNAIEKAHGLINKLGAAGGIHLLLFCMRGGRMTTTTQSNYRLFCECLCNTKVPIALVFTGLEGEVDMEDWWTRNSTHLENYGIKSDGHACITAVRDDAPGEEDKYLKSQVTIRELLKTCARKGEAYSLESHSWLARIAGEMKNFVPTKKGLKERDIMKVLTNRCKLDTNTAKTIANIVEKGATERSGSKEPQADIESGLVKNQTNSDASLNEHKPAVGVAAKKNEAEDTQPRVVRAAPDVVSGNEENAVDGALFQVPSNVQVAPGVAANGGNDFVAKKSVTPGPVPSQKSSNYKTTPEGLRPDVGREGDSARKSREKGDDRPPILELPKFEHSTKKQGDSSAASFPLAFGLDYACRADI